MEKIKFKGDFFEGRFKVPEKPDEEWSLQSPADFSDLVSENAAAYSHITPAVESARSAFKIWRALPLSERLNYLQRLKEVYQQGADEMATTISRETGKPLWESKSEVQAMISKIAITSEHSLKLIEDSRIPNALPGVEGVIRFKPRGVMAVLGPFNFPGHLPNGHIVPALMTGNTVVFKPSDKTPMVGQLMAEMFQRAEFPPGVFNLLHGRGESGKRLAAHEHVDGVLFTGSYEVGLRIKADTLNQHWKLLALEMGGKNGSIVWDDADLEKAIYENLVGGFLSSGQRCSCTSRIFLNKKIHDEFLEKFYQAAKKISIGHWSENKFMGPLISQDSVEKYLRFQEIAKREGAESVMRGKVLELPIQGNYVTPSIYSVKKFDGESVYQNCEIFGPNVAIYSVEDFSEAIEVNNQSGFGLVMSVFSSDQKLYEKALLEANVGLLNWNRTTNGASSRLPFGGVGKSGNDRPSAHFAVYYCTVPVASLEDHTTFDPSKNFPGLEYPLKS